MTLNAVILDTREPESITKLTFDVPTSTQALPCGDAWLSTDTGIVIVERKTASDLLGSIMDGRLFDQASRMTKASPWSYVVITEIPIVRSGYVWTSGRITKWRWASMMGALLTVQEMGVGVMFLYAPTQYKAALVRLANRNRDEVRPPPKRKGVMQSPGELILSSLPGISEVRARALLDHCGSAAWALMYLCGDRGGEVPGIGPATREGARRALGLDDELMLSVIMKGGERCLNHQG